MGTSLAQRIYCFTIVCMVNINELCILFIVHSYCTFYLACQCQNCKKFGKYLVFSVLGINMVFLD